MLGLLSNDLQSASRFIKRLHWWCISTMSTKVTADDFDGLQFDAELFRMRRLSTRKFLVDLSRSIGLVYY